LGYSTSGIVLGLKGQRSISSRVNKCIFTPLIVRSITKKTNDPKVFKLDIGNDLGISYKWYGFSVERSKVKAWVRTLWVPWVPL